MITSRVSYFGLVADLLGSTVGSLVRPSTVSFSDVITQIRSIGVGAIPTTTLIAITAGYVLALVLELQLSQIGKAALVPPMLWCILTEQVVPAGIALVFTCRSRSSLPPALS